MTKLTIADIESMDEGRLARLSREELMEFALGTLKTTRALADQLEREAINRPAPPSRADRRSRDKRTDARPATARRSANRIKKRPGE